jgi:hypothetical protein
MNLNTIWTALVEGFYPLGNSEMEKTANELGVGDGWITLLWASWLFASEPFSTVSFMRIRPYGSVRVIEARFAEAARQGILSVQSEGEYQCTEKGKWLTNQIVRSAEEAIAPLQPIPPAELQKILNYTSGLSKRLWIRQNRPPGLPFCTITKTFTPIRTCHCSDCFCITSGRSINIAARRTWLHGNRTTSKVINGARSHPSGAMKPTHWTHFTKNWEYPLLRGMKFWKPCAI